MQRQGRKLTHAHSHTIPTGPRACGGELAVAGPRRPRGRWRAAPGVTPWGRAQWNYIDNVLQRDAIVGIGVTAQATAGNPKTHTQNGEPAHERGPTTQNGSTPLFLTHRAEAHEQDPTQLATARSAQRAPERRKQSNTQHPTALSYNCLDMDTNKMCHNIRTIIFELIYLVWHRNTKFHRRLCLKSNSISGSKKTSLPPNCDQTSFWNILC